MPSPSRQVVIREATEADTDTIIRLIKELAVSSSRLGEANPVSLHQRLLLTYVIVNTQIYEKEPDAAKATPQLIKENIFEKKYGNCIIAETELEGKVQPVGLAIVSGLALRWLAEACSRCRLEADIAHSRFLDLAVLLLIVRTMSRSLASFALHLTD